MLVIGVVDDIADVDVLLAGVVRGGLQHSFPGLHQARMPSAPKLNFAVNPERLIKRTTKPRTKSATIKPTHKVTIAPNTPVRCPEMLVKKFVTYCIILFFKI